MAALPHTGIIAAVLTIYSIREESKNHREIRSSKQASSFSTEDRNTIKSKKLDKNILSDEINRTCPKCGAGTVLRTARKGRFSGNKFWGCERFPKCNGIRKT